MLAEITATKFVRVIKMIIIMMSVRVSVCVQMKSIYS